MIGVFDSGDGGLSAIREIRCIIPNADILFLADRKNAPYGTKTRQELIRLVSADIEKLSELGAEKILMACCTASTVFKYLPSELRKSVLPIISPAANEASLMTKNGKIGVIATEYTVHSGAFSRELSKFPNVNSVYELPTQELVTCIEGGMRDGRITESEKLALYRMLSPLKEKNIDTLILGCTHFSHLEREIGACLPRVKIISPAREGAKEITKALPERGKGLTVYIE